MLSRVADNLYWLSRYLERAEHIARLLDVNLHQLELTAAPAEQRLSRLATSLNASLSPEALENAYALASALTFDVGVSSSIISCITMSRDNARQVREQVSSEMWEQINRLYLSVRSAGANAAWRNEPHQLYKTVKEGAHLFQGITDATMSHDEGWLFIQIGRNLERASATAMLLDAHYQGLRHASTSEASLVYLDWVTLLKSVTAFEAYCKVYTADIRPDYIAEFLLLNDEFPRSVRFAIDGLQRGLNTIARKTGARGAARVERLAGRLRATLDYGQVDEIMPTLHEYLAQVQSQCSQVHSAFYNVYITYPADAALHS